MHTVARTRESRIQSHHDVDLRQSVGSRMHDNTLYGLPGLIRSPNHDYSGKMHDSKSYHKKCMPVSSSAERSTRSTLSQHHDNHAVSMY